MHRIFVYGTLKRAYWNHRLLATSDFKGEGRTVHPYVMTQHGIPFVFNPDDMPFHYQFPVSGELYEVTDEVKENLDRLEGHPHGYRRTPTVVEVNGEEVEAEMYIYQRPDPYMHPSPVLNNLYVYDGGQRD